MSIMTLSDALEHFAKWVNERLEDRLEQYYYVSYLDALRHFGVRHYEVERLMQRGLFEQLLF